MRLEMSSKAPQPKSVQWRNSGQGDTPTPIYSVPLSKGLRYLLMGSGCFLNGLSPRTVDASPGVLSRLPALGLALHSRGPLLSPGGRNRKLPHAPWMMTKACLLHDACLHYGCGRTGVTPPGCTIYPRENTSPGCSANGQLLME